MISPETIDAIASKFEAGGLSSEGLAELRSAFPKIHFTHCMDDDVGSYDAYANRPGYNIYLVDGREHCMKFTSDINHATGLVLAEVIDDD
jgi:hypothetical protein